MQPCQQLSPEQSRCLVLNGLLGRAVQLHMCSLGALDSRHARRPATRSSSPRQHPSPRNADPPHPCTHQTSPAQPFKTHQPGRTLVGVPPRAAPREERPARMRALRSAGVA